MALKRNSNENISYNSPHLRTTVQEPRVWKNGGMAYALYARSVCQPTPSPSPLPCLLTLYSLCAQKLNLSDNNDDIWDNAVFPYAGTERLLWPRPQRIIRREISRSWLGLVSHHACQHPFIHKCLMMTRGRCSVLIFPCRLLQEGKPNLFP